MHVVVIPSDYATVYNPQKTPFYRDHARLPALQGHRVGVIAPIAVSLRFALRQRRWRFGFERHGDDGPETWIYPYPAPPKTRFLDRIVRRRLTRRLLRKYVARHGRPDLLHAHGDRAAEAARHVSASTGIPYVITLHAKEFFEPQAPRLVAKLDSTLRQAALRLAVSPAFAQRLHELTGLAYKVLPNPVDTDFFSPGPPAGDPTGTFTFACVAALNDNKNHRLLLDAFARAFGGDLRYRLALAGDGPDREPVRARVAELGLSEQVDLRGQLDRESLRALYRQSQACVLASTFETFGVVLAEAMACGLPIAATRTAGAEYVVSHRALGCLSAHEPEALADAMREVALGSYDLDTLRHAVVDRFSPARVSAGLNTVYQEALGG